MISRSQNFKYVVRGYVEGIVEFMMEGMVPVKLQKRSNMNVVRLDTEVTNA